MLPPGTAQRRWPPPGRRSADERSAWNIPFPDANDYYHLLYPSIDDDGDGESDGVDGDCVRDLVCGHPMMRNTTHSRDYFPSGSPGAVSAARRLSCREFARG